MMKKIMVSSLNKFKLGMALAMLSTSVVFSTVGTVEASEGCMGYEEIGGALVPCKDVDKFKEHSGMNDLNSPPSGIASEDSQLTWYQKLWNQVTNFFNKIVAYFS